MYKIITITEGRLGALLFGGSNMPTEQVEKALNDADAAGWELAFMVVESVRNVIFWNRERVIITLKRKDTQ